MTKPVSLARQFLRTIVILGSVAWSLEAKADEAPPFPSDANSWINSGPLSISGLKGKGIVLWFFEEECPKCRERWPEMMSISKKFERDPVIFIAVNSGTPRAQLEAYANELNITWPIIVDTSRDFEKACQMIQEISLENISQIRYVKPDGEIQAGLTDDIEAVAKLAAEGAEWKLSPIGIPESLHKSWYATEIGNYKGLAAALKKPMASPKSDVKEMATKLMGIVKQEMTDQLAAIKEAQESGNSFKAYEQINGYSERFMGFEIPKDVASLKKDLQKDERVKAGLAAMKTLESARKQLQQAGASGAKNKAHDKAIKALEKIVTDFPETSLARQAQAVIKEAN